MIERIDIPDKNSFENDLDGVQPYYSKRAIPISLIKYTNTVRTVKNDGITMDCYRSTSNAINMINTSFSGVTPIVKFYYSNGLPPFFTANDSGINWATKYRMKFFAPYTGNYTLAFGGSGEISNVYIDNSKKQIQRGNENGDSIILHYNDTSYGIATSSFSSETWHSISFLYNAYKQTNNSYGLIAMWKSDNSETPNYIPLSAGVCAPINQDTSDADDGETIKSHTAYYYSNINYSVKKEQIATLTFDIPLMASTTVYAGGYKHTSNGFIDTVHNITLQQDRMVEYYEGYRIYHNDNFAIDASACSYIEVPYHQSLACTAGGITLESWVKVSPGCNGGYVITKPYQNADGAAAEYAMYISNTGGITFNMYGEGYTYDTDIRDNLWHHIVLSANGSIWNWYIDGSSAKSQTTTKVPGNVNSKNIRFGANILGTNHLESVIDEIKIFGRGLSSAEAKYHYNNGNGRRKSSPTEQLRGYWRFSEGSGTVVNDSYNTNHGSISGITSSTWITGKISERDEYVKKFTGHIKDFKTNYKTDEIDSIQVYCEDFTSFMKESFNVYSPSYMDYIQVGYTTKRGELPNKSVEGIGKPKTFDGWELYKVMHVLMTESFIDPYLFYKHKIHTDNYGCSINGNFKIRWTNSTSNILKMDTREYYGNPNVISGDGNVPDDAYINTAGFGEYYYDIAMNLLSPFYIDFYFDRYGHPFMFPYNTPTSITHISSFDGVNSFSSTESIKYLFGEYYHTTATVTSSADFTGKRIDVVCGVSPNSGVISPESDEYSLKITIKNNGNTISTQYLNLYYATTWGYNNGIAPTLGYNPSVFKLTNLMAYDTYRIIFETNPDGTSYDIALNGIMTYDENYETGNVVIETDDSNSRGGITNLSIEDSVKDTRNEVYVYGALRGVVYTKDTDGNRSDVNPNNPIYNYYYSISRDINSIYTSTAFNYRGRPIRILIQDPKISNNTQADMVSYNILQTYRQKHLKPSIGIIPNPLIDILDCVNIVDNYKNYINESNNVWIDGITTKMNNSNNSIDYTMDVDFTEIKPPTGYFYQPDIPSSVINGQYIKNINIENSGCLFRLDASDEDFGSYSYVNYLKIDTSMYTHKTGVVQYNVLEKIPSTGYLRINNEIVLYEHTSPTSKYIWLLKRGLQGTHTLPYGKFNAYGVSHIEELRKGYTVSMAYDPYMSETIGVLPTVNFDCMKNGKIQIKVWGRGVAEDYHVATLTGIDDDENYPYSGYQKIKWGNHSFVWQAIDQFGIYNQLLSKGEVRSGGFYVCEHPSLYKQYTPGVVDKMWNGIIDDDKIVNNGKLSPYGEFYVTIDFESDDGEQYHYTGATAGGFNDSDRHIYTRRGPVGISFLKLHTSGIYGYIDQAATSFSGVATTNFTGEFIADNAPYRVYRCGVDYPTESVYFQPKNNYLVETYIKNTSNNGDGVRLTLYDASFDLSSSNTYPYLSNYLYTQYDKYAQREYKIEIKCHIVTVSINTLYDGGPHEALVVPRINEKVKTIIKDDNFRTYFNGGNGITLKFNPKGAVDDDNNFITYLPPELLDQWKIWMDKGIYRVNSLVNNYLIFDGTIYDRSGRLVHNRCENGGGMFEHIGKNVGIPPYELRRLMFLADGKWHRWQKSDSDFISLFGRNVNIKDGDIYIDDKLIPSPPYDNSISIEDNLLMEKYFYISHYDPYNLDHEYTRAWVLWRDENFINNREKIISYVYRVYGWDFYYLALNESYNQLLANSPEWLWYGQAFKSKYKPGSFPFTVFKFSHDDINRYLGRV